MTTGTLLIIALTGTLNILVYGEITPLMETHRPRGGGEGYAKYLRCLSALEKDMKRISKFN